MSRSVSLLPMVKSTVVALLVAALGFAMQIAFGLAVPTIPPGLVILVVGAALVAFVQRRWAPVIGVIVGVFLLFGFFASGAIANLSNAAQIGILVGAWIQFIALIAAAIVGFIALLQNYRSSVAIAGTIDVL